MKMEKKKAVLVDIDGTLVTVTENWSMERDLEWVEDTLKAEGLDKGIALLKAFKMLGYELVFLTARGQSCKKNTWKKLRQLKIDHLVDSMWHRPSKWENVSSSVYKKEMIKMPHDITNSSGPGLFIFDTARRSKRSQKVLQMA